MSSGGGTTQVQTNEIPEWLQEAGKANLAKADYISQLGYIPYYGNDVAAFSPMQQQAMQNTANTASAFFGTPQMDAMAGMPRATTDNLGFSGYSSGNLYDQAMSQLQQRAPAQYAAYRDMFIDPQTGEANVMFTPYGSVASPDAAATTQGLVNYSSTDGNGVGTTGTSGDYYDFISSAPVEWLSKNFGEPSAVQGIAAPVFSILGSLARDKVTDYYNPVKDAGYDPVIPVSAGGNWSDYDQFYSSDSGSSDMTGYTGGEGWSTSTVSDQGGNLSGGYITGGW